MFWNYQDTRKEEMEVVAKKLGMEFSPTDEWGLHRQLSDFRLFNRGGRKRITNIIRQVDDWHEIETHVFDYKYTISTGKSSRTFKQTVFFVESKKLGLPEFWMEPETFFQKIGNLLGMQDIDFASYPQFSTQYQLKGDDEEFIRMSLNDHFLKFFTIEPGWTLEGINFYMLFYRFDWLLDTTSIAKLYQKGMKVHQMLAMDNNPS